jgi:hypothetical protein
MLAKHEALFDLTLISLVGAGAFGARLVCIGLWVTILVVLVRHLRARDRIPRAEVVRSLAFHPPLEGPHTDL